MGRKVIDETNNTADLIDNQFGLLETTIVPVSAMAKIVNIFNITNSFKKYYRLYNFV